MSFKGNLWVIKGVVSILPTLQPIGKIYMASNFVVALAANCTFS